jgi:hypothetical protein
MNFSLSGLVKLSATSILKGIQVGRYPVADEVFRQQRKKAIMNVRYREMGHKANVGVHQVFWAVDEARPYTRAIHLVDHVMNPKSPLELDGLRMAACLCLSGTYHGEEPYLHSLRTSKIFSEISGEDHVLPLNGRPLYGFVGNQTEEGLVVFEIFVKDPSLILSFLGTKVRVITSGDLDTCKRFDLTYHPLLVTKALENTFSMSHRGTRFHHKA